MSAPFAPSPKFRDYVEWARINAGCTIKEGTRGLKSIVRIEAPSGRAVHQIGVADNETLSHSLVAYLDRRLGIDSPFPKTPDPYS
jgi:hypothetical protein